MNKLLCSLLLVIGLGSQAHAKNEVVGTYQVAQNECYLVSKSGTEHVAKRADCTAHMQSVTVLSSTRYSIPRADGAHIVGTHVLMMTPAGQVLDVNIPLFAGM